MSKVFTRSVNLLSILSSSSEKLSVSSLSEWPPSESIVVVLHSGPVMHEACCTNFVLGSILELERTSEGSCPAAPSLETRVLNAHRLSVSYPWSQTVIDGGGWCCPSRGEEAAAHTPKGAGKRCEGTGYWVAQIRLRLCIFSPGWAPGNFMQTVVELKHPGSHRKLSPRLLPGQRQMKLSGTFSRLLATYLSSFGNSTPPCAHPVPSCPYLTY